jgi:hypothetical protein
VIGEKAWERTSLSHLPFKGRRENGSYSKNLPPSVAFSVRQPGRRRNTKFSAQGYVPNGKPGQGILGRNRNFEKEVQEMMFVLLCEKCGRLYPNFKRERTCEDEDCQGKLIPVRLLLKDEDNHDRPESQDTNLYA